MANLTSSLIARMVDQISGPARKAAKSLRGVKAAGQGINGVKVGGRLAEAVKNTQMRTRALQSQMVGVAGTAYVLANAIARPVNAFKEFQSSVTDVKKVVDDFQGESGKGALNKYIKEISDLSKEVPVAIKDLNKIAAIGAQAGLKPDQLIDFARLTAEASEAFQIESEEMGESLAALRTALGLEIPGVRMLAGHMNILANNMSTTEAKVLDVVTRVAALGGVSGVNAKSIAALGAAMTASGVRSETASTAVRNVLLNMQSGANATKSAKKAFKTLGLDSKKVAKDMQKNGPGVVLDLFERITKLAPHLRSQTLESLFGKRAVDALGPLIGNLDTLRDAYGLVSDDAKAMTAVQKEAAVRFADFEAKMQLFSNKVRLAAIQLGAALAPAILKITDALGPMIGAFADFSAAHPGLVTALAGVTAGIVALRLATVAGAFGFNQLKLGVLQMAMPLGKLGGAALSPVKAGLMSLLGTVQIAGLRFRMAGKAFKAGQVGLAGLAQAGFATIARGMLSIVNPVGLATGALKLLKLAVIGTGVGAALIAIGAAGTLIYNNWSGIKEMFKGFKEGYMEALGPLAETLSPITNLISTLWEKFSSLTGNIGASNEQWQGWGKTIGRIAAGPAKALVWAIEKVAAALAWVGETAAKAAGAVSNFFSSGGGGGYKQPPGMKGPQSSNTSGKRASGGPVLKGHTYQINEKGQETFTPGRMGTINPAKSNGPGGGAMINFNPSFQISGGSNLDEDQLVAKLEERMRKAAEEMFEGVYGDTSFRMA